MSGSYSTWPFSCPRAWSRTPQPSLVRSAVEDGYPKVRRRFTKSWDTYQAEWLLEWTQEQAFMTFFEQDCQDGSAPFYMPNPYNETEMLLVRWKEPPAVAGSVDTKPSLRVTGNLERMFS